MSHWIVPLFRWSAFSSGCVGCGSNDSTVSFQLSFPFECFHKFKWMEILCWLRTRTCTWECQPEPLPPASCEVSAPLAHEGKLALELERINSISIHFGRKKLPWFVNMLARKSSPVTNYLDSSTVLDFTNSRRVWLDRNLFEMRGIAWVIQLVLPFGATLLEAQYNREPKWDCVISLSVRWDSDRLWTCWDLLSPNQQHLCWLRWYTALCFGLSSFDELPINSTMLTHSIFIK